MAETKLRICNCEALYASSFAEGLQAVGAMGSGVGAATDVSIPPALLWYPLQESYRAQAVISSYGLRSIFHSLPLIIHGSVTNLYVAILSRAWVTLAIGSTPCNVWLDSWSYIAGRFWVHKPDG